ncbi:amino acid transporter [Aspergillus steynii IBT 23096]|uniref:Amino acid transporter n=1 Tax=Aspergillus steynii IBT 23096 TaxID=1392250 RepID=A0A2I2G069_9EURO|nr:amino acid transporter [Aspergillus steynii IBT 23096]PLB46264.1 amino acid transporter [Aspergillus steynii IBT 23096]
MFSDSKEQTASTSEEDGEFIAHDRDDANLAQIGKKAVLKQQRNFGVLSILGFSCTIIATWEGLLDTFIVPLQNGGPAGAIYSYIVAWIGTACSFAVLAELSSMAPTSGGQYHWCAMLAPPSTMKFMSYITGWVTLIGWQAAFASVSYLAGTEVQGAAIFAYSHYQPQAWHGTLLLWAVVVVAMAVNMIPGKFFPRLETGIFFMHIAGFLAIVIALTSMADHKSAHEVFTDFRNGGNLPADGISFFVGMMGCVFGFAGGDAAVHMAEECNNASVAIPRAILLNIAINGTLGFSIMVAVLFCMGDVQQALDSPTGYPFFEIFHQAMGTTSGGLGLSLVLVIMSICAVLGTLTAVSRQFWSFARDRGVPGWRIWSHVSTRNHLPTYSVFLTMTVAGLLGLINIGSSVALNGVLSMAVSGLYLSYLIVGALLLYRRCTGAVHLPRDVAVDGLQKNVPGAQLVWGPFHIPGVWGILVNGYAVVHMTIVVFFSLWPTEIPVSATNMNFSVVGTMGTILLAVVYYVLRARKAYQGPVIETLN